jgi:hypothetical protein
VAARAQEKRSHQEIRKAVSRLCRLFPGEHRRKLDREQTDATELVDKLTHQGGSVLSILKEFDAYRAGPITTDLIRDHVDTRDSGQVRPS